MASKSGHAGTSSGILIADTEIKSSGGLIYWVTLSDDQPCTIQLSDDTAGTADKWQVSITGTDAPFHGVFNPPMVFETGIYLDMPTGTGDAIIWYS